MSANYESVDGLTVLVDGPLLRLSIDRPGGRNALTDTSVAGLVRALEAAATDGELRAVLLTGVGEHFCGGFDIVGRNAGGAAKPRTGSVQRRMPLAANRLLSLVLETQLPVVCAVRGWAVGIGAQLALAADVTVTAEDARFWWPFLRRGFTPDSASTYLLPRIVGPARARELLLLHREISGAEAQRWGLVARVAAAADVMAEAEVLAAELAAGPTAALGLTKSLLAASFDNDLPRQLAAEAYAMELSSRSPDFREGMRALVEKRPPAFEGR